jgi:hypothetical protein
MQILKANVYLTTSEAPRTEMNASHFGIQGASAEDMLDGPAPQLNRRHS